MRTTAGRDFMAAQTSGVASVKTASWIGVTADATPPAANDTTLAGEIAAGTLLRAQGIYAHTSGTSSFSVSYTYTSDQSIVLAKVGVFTDSHANGGTMVFEDLLAAVATLVTGDQVQIVETIGL